MLAQKEVAWIMPPYFLLKKIIAKAHDVPWQEPILLCSLAKVMGSTPEDFLTFAENFLIKDVHSAEEVCTYLEISVEELQVLASNYNIEDVGTKHFKILPRVRHVMLEYRNIARFIDACDTEDLPSIGACITRSHRSLKDNYDVSVDKLDELVEFALQAGALGARLTGAGFGGAIIAAVRKEEATELETRLKSYAAENGIDESLVFQVKPAGGAIVVRNVLTIED